MVQASLVCLSVMARRLRIGITDQGGSSWHQTQFEVSKGLKKYNKVKSRQKSQFRQQGFNNSETSQGQDQNQQDY